MKKVLILLFGFAVSVLFYMEKSPEASFLYLTHVYGTIAFFLLFVVMLAGPLYRVFPTLPLRGGYFSSLSGLGILTFYYAWLHACVGFFKLFHGFAGLRFLGGTYIVAVILGFSALLILAALAGTSFEWAMKALGPRWKTLHRYVYLAGFLVLLHLVFIKLHTHGFDVLTLVEALAAATIAGLHITARRTMRAAAVLVLVAIVGIGHVAEAHLLDIDGSIGAVMHIDPNDEPVANQSAEAYFEFKDTAQKFVLADCRCTLSVVDKGATIITLPAAAQVPLVFPHAGPYKITVDGESLHANFSPFHLSYDVSVAGSGDVPGWKKFLGGHGAHVVLFGGAILMSMYAILEDKFRGKKL